MINNLRQKSVRKKTASRIAAIQVLYIYNFNNESLGNSINIFEKNYKEFLLKELDIKVLDFTLFNDLLNDYEKYKSKIDKIIKNHLSKNWKIERLGINELDILRLSVFELCFLKKFDNKTIINEYVSIFQNFCGNPNFANGFLNKISLIRSMNLNG